MHDIRSFMNLIAENDDMDYEDEDTLDDRPASENSIACERDFETWLASSGIASKVWVVTVPKADDYIDLAMIQVVDTNDRKGGLGKQIMLALCASAEKHRVTIRLDPSSQDDQSHPDLEKWYKSFGFYWDDDRTYMERYK